ncbi:TonB-dependent siderophore receptor [Thauera linaloolentis]|uniref:TonB-dependent siderophore receptor n=1 Tax=Thauera linaloolentis (strain DSM 12138 / JCM 21573 / CCUG 41526 / CIP 105981 / IAM 15112 / NBRC 102519 / 47Lol) TaxID=1123367 RepID=N6XW24_THAL4|nr:TonB-dependent siderophore receptor [Thauera linaloolentis]ENO85966.1 TonB-dependent siderophore receptor [Thauera linaloolentis 47Lol = DSM 12138]MCM8567196.1 TonB-dependent siderophore receptor [Thauera linaloolentis]
MRQPRLILAPLAIATALAMGLNTPARAQPAAPAGVFDVSIAPQPLGQALNELARQAGLQLLFPPALVAGRIAPAISGTLTAREALDRLLAGSGLVATMAGRKVTVRQAPSPSSSTGPTLAAVRVTADALRDGLTESTGAYTTGTTNAATGMNLSLRETPQSVTVITRQRMDDQGLKSLTDAVEQTPGIHVQRMGPVIGGYQRIYSRGYAVDSYQIDGVPTSARALTSYDYTGTASLDAAIYDSVAVVRGATGLLTGAGDPSASANVMRKRPTNDFQGSLELGLGRWDQRRAVADIGGPLNVAGSLRGRLVAAYDESESWYDRYKGDRHLFYGVLDADLSEKTTLTLAFEYAREKSNALENQGLNAIYTDGTPTPFSRHDSGIPEWGLWDQKRQAASLSLEHRFNDDWQVRLNYGHSKRETPVVKRAYVNGIDPGNTTSWGVMARTGYESDVDTLDARLSGRYTLFGKRHDLVAGFNASSYEYENRPDFFGIEFPIGMPIVNGVPQYVEPDWDAITAKNGSYTREQTKESGLYLATRLQASVNLSVILGGRWSNWHYKRTSMPGGNVGDDRKYSNEFTPYAGVVYDLTKQISVYGSYTEIFKPQSVKDASGDLLDPEQGTNRELGLKAEWFGGRLNASVAMFKTGKDNLAVEDTGKTTPDGNQAYIAKDDTGTKGWEVEMAGELMPGWNLQGGYTRVISRDSDGKRLNTIRPIHQFKLFSTYALQKIPGLTLGGGIHWQSKIHDDGYARDIRQHVTQESYIVVNLMARHAFNERLSLIVNLNNAFNKTYRTNPAFHDYGAQRNLYATLKYQF